MNYYLSSFKKGADFKGRASRKEFWVFYFFFIIILLAGHLFELKIGIVPENDKTVLLPYILLLHGFPYFAVTIRRLHDTGHSGWWMFIPIANLILLFLAGNPKENKYGPTPSIVVRSQNKI